MFTIITYGNIFFLSFIIESNSLYGYILIQYSFSVLVMIIICILIIIIIIIIIKGVTSLIDYSPNRTFQGQ